MYNSITVRALCRDLFLADAAAAAVINCSINSTGQRALTTAARGRHKLFRTNTIKRRRRGREWTRRRAAQSGRHEMNESCSGVVLVHW